MASNGGSSNEEGSTTASRRPNGAVCTPCLLMRPQPPATHHPQQHEPRSGAPPADRHECQPSVDDHLAEVVRAGHQLESTACRAVAAGVPARSGPAAHRARGPAAPPSLTCLSFSWCLHQPAPIVAALAGNQPGGTHLGESCRPACPFWRRACPTLPAASGSGTAGRCPAGRRPPLPAAAG